MAFGMKPGYERPINSTASRVVATGESFQYAEEGCITESPFPMPTWKPSDPSFTDLTGLKKGRLTVIGFSEQFRGRWVCRCACGTYCIRKTKGLKSEVNPVLPCHQCYRLAVALKSAHFKKTGRERPITDFL